MTSVQVDDLKATFSYQDGRLHESKAFAWGAGAAGASIERTYRYEGERLVAIDDDTFPMTLDWSSTGSVPECDSDAYQPVLERVTKQGPGLEDVWSFTHRDGNLTAADNVRSYTDPATPDAPPMTFEVSTDESYGSSTHGIPTDFDQTIRYPIPDVAPPDGEPAQNPAPIPVIPPVVIHEPRTVAATERRVNEYLGEPVQYDPSGNLQLYTTEKGAHFFHYDAFRRLTKVETPRGGTNTTADIDYYTYDIYGRRVHSSNSPYNIGWVYAWQGSRVIAIDLGSYGYTQWLYAIGYGPNGPCFIKSLTAQGKSYYIATDHLGTPYAYLRHPEDRLLW